MNTLVLPPRYTTDSIAMSRAAAHLNWRVERLASWRVPEALCDTGVAIYGEPLFVTVVAGPLGVRVLEPTADWLPTVPEEHRKRRVRLMTLGEARNVSETAFIKPVSDKCFAAKVYASGAELPPASVLDDLELVLISEPVAWEVEFRAFVLDRQVVALSPYLHHGELVERPDGTWAAGAGETEAAEAFCRTVLADTGLPVPPAFVLDVGSIAGRGWAVVEANAAWGSGLYGCEPEQVLRVVRRACVPMHEVQAGDVPWLKDCGTVEAD